MIELVYNKIKCKFINNIKDIKLIYQIVIFYNNFDEVIEFNDLMQKIKKFVSVVFKSINMIWMLRLKYQFNYGVVGYI